MTVPYHAHALIQLVMTNTRIKRVFQVFQIDSRILCLATIFTSKFLPLHHSFITPRCPLLALKSDITKPPSF